MKLFTMLTLLLFTSCAQLAEFEKQQLRAKLGLDKPKIMHHMDKRAMCVEKYELKGFSAKDILKLCKFIESRR